MNNRRFHAGEIAATLNGTSIYIVAKRQGSRIKDERGDPLWQDIEHALMPAGPAGRYGLQLPIGHMLMRYSKNQRLAKDCLRWLHDPQQLQSWLKVSEGYSLGPSSAWEGEAVWRGVDRSLRPIREVGRFARMFGHSGAPTIKATEAFTKYIVIDMYAKAVQGMAAEDAVRSAEADLKRIYER